jgi:hypothetical protein
MDYAVHFADGAVEGKLIGFGGAPEAAELPDELERGCADFLICGRRFKIMQGLDAPALRLLFAPQISHPAKPPVAAMLAGRSHKMRTTIKTLRRAVVIEYSAALAISAGPLEVRPRSAHME